MRYSSKNNIGILQALKFYPLLLKVTCQEYSVIYSIDKISITRPNGTSIS